MTRTIGFPRETDPAERRTLLTPSVALALRDGGFRVQSEKGIGAGVYLDDAELAAAGVCFTDPEAVWSAGLVVRYKSPDSHDLARLTPGQSIAALFHAEGSPDLLATLTERAITAYSFEFLHEHGHFALATAGGRIAGAQAVLHGAWALQAHHGGRGVLLASVAGAPRAQVVVIGCGNVGAAAADTAAALGAQVSVLAHTSASADRYREHAPAGAQVVVNTLAARTAALASADLVIGAILISTYDTPAMITAEDLTRMRPGAVIVDATCGYGRGYLPTAGPVQQPGDAPRTVGGILHVKLDALPALVPVTATAAYTDRIAPYLVRLARVALAGATDPAIDSARIATGGRLVHPICQQHATFYSQPASATATPGPAAVVNTYTDRARFARAETAGIGEPRRLPRLLEGITHVAEIPCGSGHFLTSYTAADARVTLVDANAAMLDTAITHARDVGVDTERITPLRGYLHEVRLPEDIDLVVIPNAALNQLAHQYTLDSTLTVLRAAIAGPGVTVLAQVLCRHDDGTIDRARFYDPDQLEDTWIPDRDLPTGAEWVRRRRQRHFGDRLHVDLEYLDQHGTALHTTGIDLALFTPESLRTGLAAAGFTDVHLLPGRGGLSEVQARTGEQ